MDLRAEAFQPGSTAQDGAAEWEVHPGGREVDSGGDRETGGVAQHPEGQALRPQVE